MPPSTSPIADTPPAAPGEAAGILHPPRPASILGTGRPPDAIPPALLPATRADVEALAARIAVLEQQNAELVGFAKMLATQHNAAAHIFGLLLCLCRAAGKLDEGLLRTLFVAASDMGAVLQPCDAPAWDATVTYLRHVAYQPPPGEAAPPVVPAPAPA